MHEQWKIALLILSCVDMVVEYPQKVKKYKLREVKEISQLDSEVCREFERSSLLSIPASQTTATVRVHCNTSLRNTQEILLDVSFILWHVSSSSSRQHPILL